MKTLLLSASLATLAIGSSTSLKGQVPLEVPLPDTKAEMVQRMQSLRIKYANDPIAFESEDYRIFRGLQNDLKMARSLIPELIDLTDVKRKRPDTTESFTAYWLSPAGAILFAVRDASEPQIKTRLAAGGLSSTQTEVLQEVLRLIEAVRNQK